MKRKYRLKNEGQYVLDEKPKVIKRTEIGLWQYNIIHNIPFVLTFILLFIFMYAMVRVINSLDEYSKLIGLIVLLYAFAKMFVSLPRVDIMLSQEELHKQ